MAIEEHIFLTAGKKPKYSTFLFPLVMRTIRIYSLNNFQICHTTVLSIVVTLYIIISAVLIYLITGILYLLTICIQFPTPTSLLPSDRSAKSSLSLFNKDNKLVISSDNFQSKSFIVQWLPFLLNTFNKFVAILIGGDTKTERSQWFHSLVKKI